MEANGGQAFTGYISLFICAFIHSDMMCAVGTHSKQQVCGQCLFPRVIISVQHCIE